MVVIITSTGGVSKMLATFEGPVDPGLVTWAGEFSTSAYRVSGWAPACSNSDSRAHALGHRAGVPRSTCTRLQPAGSWESEDTIYVEGAARLLSEVPLADVTQINELWSLLERRVVLLGVLRSALGEPGVYVRIGQENEIPAMRSMALVAASYGVAQRKLGAVSVIGPVSMNYAHAIPMVRDIAHELSRFLEDAYAES